MNANRLLLSVSALLLFVVPSNSQEYNCDNPGDLHDCVTLCFTSVAGLDCCEEHFTGEDELHCAVDVACYWYPELLICPL